jgi:hypothetical protein
MSSPKIGAVLGLPMNKKVIRREWAQAMMTMSWPLGLSVLVHTVFDSPIAQAREYICEEAVKLGAKYVWFVDDDTVPPQNALLQLTYALDQDSDAGMISGIVCSKTKPTLPILYKTLGQGTYWDWTVGEVFPVEGIGCACTLIRLSVLERLSRPWFKTTETADKIEGEDIHFCRKLGEAGGKILAHGGVLCKHWNTDTGEVFELPADSKPYALKAVKS